MKNYILRSAGVAVLLIVAILGCQTAKPALVAPAESAIQVEKSGFSPAGAPGQNSIDISVLYGNGDAIKSWKVELTNNGMVQKTWTGDSKYLPASLTWDGKSDTGAMAPEGTYTAKLSIDYASKYQSVSEESKSFVLDITPPTGTIALDPAQFTPSESGVEGPVTLTINASSALAHMDSWSLDVLDPAGGFVKNWSGQWPNTSATWDGSSMIGGFVTPATTYRATATVRDEYGNSSQLKVDVPVAQIPMATEQNRVQVSAAGFSPLSDSLPKSIDLGLTFGNVSALKSWKVSVTNSDGVVQRSWTGRCDQPPANDFLGWTDGIRRLRTGGFVHRGPLGRLREGVPASTRKERLFHSRHHSARGERL